MSFSRGSFSRGDQRRSGPSFSRAQPWSEPKTQPKPLGPLGRDVDSIDSNTLLVEEDFPTIERVDYVASYNWVDGAHPVILVPGKLVASPSNPLER